ncbi:unnamed protein product [Trifolium pratense]|uniref:Uncharacterized protein n=1 Tax=Trifolium pratense TaxID=57577 RepID=A0ACB0KXZ5_TRIPR|nr:unnamed protein product [Trifolium pratense]
MEEQEEGEHQALQADAKDWLEQWFSFIKPWETSAVDNERVSWVRVYGIPAHAWNVDFFDLICKAYGMFINADDGTMKKNTMDVARLMLRTKSHKVIDDVFEAIINGEIFSMRIIEDSYGPMRILSPAKPNYDGRDDSIDSSNEEEELGSMEDVVSASDNLDHIEQNRVLDEETMHSMALVALPNSNVNRVEVVEIVEESLPKEVIPNQPNNNVFSLHSDSHDDQGELGVYDNGSFNNSQFISSPAVNSVEKGTVSSEPNVNSPVLSSNLNLSQERGMGCKPVSKGVMGCDNSIANSKLNHILEPIICVAQGGVKTNPKKKSIGLIKENNIIHQRPPLYDTSRNKTSTGLSAKGLEVKNDKCTRNPVGKIKKPNIASNSVSSAGTVLCCSSLQSSDIRNCNKVFLKNREKEVTSKIWKGARDLGVGGEEDEDVCIHHIHNNERRDEDGRILRAQQKKCAK